MSAPLRAAVERLRDRKREVARALRAGTHGETPPYQIRADRLDKDADELDAILADHPEPGAHADDLQATLDRVVDQLIHDRAGLLGLIGKLMDAKEAAEAKCSAEPGETPRENQCPDTTGGGRYRCEWNVGHSGPHGRRHPFLKWSHKPADSPEAARPAQEEATECRCDCVNCVTGNHDGCYYRPGECALKVEARPPLTCVHGVLLTRPCVGCDTPSAGKD